MSLLGIEFKGGVKEEGEMDSNFKNLIGGGAPDAGVTLIWCDKLNGIIGRSHLKEI